MGTLKEQLLAAIARIDGLEDRPSPVAGGSALFYRGKEFAHFHDAEELDLRLGAPLIRAQGLAHPAGSIHHPTRSPNSPWIELRFRSAGEVEQVARLIRLAIGSP